MKKIALLGLGKMGQNHLRVLTMLKEVELVGLFDTNAELLTKHCQAIGINVPNSVEEAVKDAQAVVICSPTFTHADFIFKVAAVGIKHIFVEKPMADTLASAIKVRDLAKAQELNIQVGFIERFNPAIAEVKKILSTAEHVISVDFARTNKISSRITDVDVVTDLMIHDIDLALYLNGPANQVEAKGVANNEVIDFAIATLKHINGRFSRIQASRITEKKIRSVQATCTDMFVDCNLLRKEIIIHRDSQTKQISGEAYKISSQEESIEVRPQEALLTELQAFIQSINDPATIKPSEDAGLEAMEICDLIRRAVLS
jgi:predicted dehydrogenase